jgi:hypothetical protein
MSCYIEHDCIKGVMGLKLNARKFSVEYKQLPASIRQMTEVWVSLVNTVNGIFLEFFFIFYNNNKKVIDVI